MLADAFTALYLRVLASPALGWAVRTAVGRGRGSAAPRLALAVVQAGTAVPRR